MNKAALLSLKLTLLTTAFVLVAYGIYHFKSQGFSDSTKSILGISADKAEARKAKVIFNEND